MGSSVSVRSDLLLGQLCTIADMVHTCPRNMTGTRKYIRERTSSGEDMLWMPEVADLVERVNRGAHLTRLECNVEVDRGARG